jgi:hypothetical protein
MDDGITPRAHQHASDALQRLADGNPENQAVIAKHAVSLLSNPSAGAQRRAAKTLQTLGARNLGSPVLIVNAGAISPLVNLLALGITAVKEEAASALATLSLNSPSTQLAISTGIITLLGTGNAETQEHVTGLLLTLSQDNDNRMAISKAGAIPRLVTQLRTMASPAGARSQELAAAVLARLSGDSDKNVSAIATAGGVRSLVPLLASSSAAAQAHAAACLSDLCRTSLRNKNAILAENGIQMLVTLLSNPLSHSNTKAEAAGALLALSSGQPENQKAIADAGAIKPLVALLGEDDNYARRKAAGALAAIGYRNTANQNAVDKFNGIEKLIALLGPTMRPRESSVGRNRLVTRDVPLPPDTEGAGGSREPVGRSRLMSTDVVGELVGRGRLMSTDVVGEPVGRSRLVTRDVVGSTTLALPEEGASTGIAPSAVAPPVQLPAAAAGPTAAVPVDDEVRAEAAAALAVLARENAKIQDKVARVGGIEPLVALLQGDHVSERAKEEVR